jgi:hypothetical protein
MISPKERERRNALFVRNNGQPAYSTKSYFKTATSHKYTRAQDTRYYGIYYGHSKERESLLIVVAVRELASSVAPKLARAKESIHMYSLFLSSLHEPDDLVSYHPRDRLARRNAH